MSQPLRYFIVCLVLAAGFALAYPFRKVAVSSNAESEKVPAENLVLRTDVDLKPQHESENPERSAVRILDIVPSADDISDAISHTSTLTFGQGETDAANQSENNRRPHALPSIEESAQRLPSITKYLNEERTSSRQTADRPTNGRKKMPQKSELRRKRSERFTLHRIVDGDDLRNLSSSYLNNADRHLDIFELNRDVLSHPDVLPLHTEIKIPVE